MGERTNEEWLSELSRKPPGNEAAIGELRAFVVARLRFVLKGGRKEREDLAEDIAQETVVKVLDSMSTFRGESRFTTWVARIAINLAY
ncbi:MAG TPA: sigma factor, partial [Spirochaetia bacterium]|nr:sigma factor [Spirochaetia bacterium]